MATCTKSRIDIASAGYDTEELILSKDILATWFHANNVLMKQFKGKYLVKTKYEKKAIISLILTVARQHILEIRYSVLSKPICFLFNRQLPLGIRKV